MKRVTLILMVVAGVLASIATFSSLGADASDSTLAETSVSEGQYLAQLASPDAAERIVAIRALAGNTTPAVTNALLANLGDPDAQAGYYTALALSTNPSPIVVDSLVAELANENTLVRQRAILALSEMNVEINVAPLAVAFEDPAISGAVAQVLVGMDNIEAHNLLLTALADDALTTRRHAAMVAIEQADRVVANYILGRALGSEDLILRRNAHQLRDIMHPPAIQRAS